MWHETKRGLYKQFIFRDFRSVLSFLNQAAEFFDTYSYYPRCQNENNVVNIWLPNTPKTGLASSISIFDIANQLDATARSYELPSETPLEISDAKKATYLTEVKLYADGGSRGNPGPSASGFVILSTEGETIYKNGEYLGITTNNQAEYQALRLGLEAALHMFGARTVHVYMDSLLVINQMKGTFKVRNRDLWPVHDAVQKLVKKFIQVDFNHIPRELNKLADAEVNKCLDAAHGQT